LKLRELLGNETQATLAVRAKLRGFQSLVELRANTTSCHWRLINLEQAIFGPVRLFLDESLQNYFAV
jgi:hypothetical protein